MGRHPHHILRSPHKMALSMWHSHHTEPGAASKEAGSVGASPGSGTSASPVHGKTDLQFLFIKKLLGTSASLLVTNALLLVTRSYLFNWNQKLLALQFLTWPTFTFHFDIHCVGQTASGPSSALLLLFKPNFIRGQDAATETCRHLGTHAFHDATRSPTSGWK